MNVSAVIVTRGNVDLDKILASLPPEWERVVWDNTGTCEVYDGPNRMVSRVQLDVPDLAVYGRYAAIEYAAGDLIYVQDDDCVVEDPAALLAPITLTGDLSRRNFVACNMPPEFRHDFYREHALVGFGAAFHRDAPQRAFDRFGDSFDESAAWVDFDIPRFHRTCDVVFTALTPRVFVDVPYRNLPWATADDRMYRQPEHVGERKRMLELALKVRYA